MVALAAPPYVLADTLCCLGLGFFLAVCYDMSRFVFGGSRPVCFVLDVAAAFAAAVLACSFAASRSYSGVVRWYMAAGLALGLAGYFFVLAPGCAAAQRLVKWTIARPFVFVWLLAVRPLARLCGRAAGAARDKLRAAAKKRRKKQLKNKGCVLYNSDNPSGFPRGQCAHFSAKEAGSMEKKQKRAPLLPRVLLRAGLVLIGGYLVAGLVFNQVDIAAKQKELQDLENQLEQQRQQNDELERVLESGSDLEIIERVARDKLGYAKPNERVFIDVTGQ